jgi:hypothetical protein
MAGKRRRIRHYDVVTDLAIVCDVSLSHKQIIIADLRQAAAASGSAMNGHEFAYLIMFPDLGRGRFASVFEVLWRKPDGNERKNVSSFTYGGLSIDYDVRFEPNIVAQHNLFSDDRKSTYVAV